MARRSRSDLVSDFDIAATVFKAFANGVNDAGGGDEDVRRIVTDSELRRKVGELVMEGRQKQCNAASTFNLWRTIKLGTGLMTADDFRRALKAAGHGIGDWANYILGQRAFTASTKETEVDLVMVSVSELGFPNGATRQEIYQKAQELGLMLCPAEVGPQLRLQYPDQPLDQGFLIGMEPIADSDGYPGVFRVGRGGGGSWLGSDYGYAGGFWGGDGRWGFVCRK